MNNNLVTLRGRVSGADRRAIVGHMRTLEQACHQLLDLSHPSSYDSPFLRREGLPRQDAEQVHRLVSRLLSQIFQAARELGLDRTIQYANQETVPLVSNMKGIAEQLADFRSGNPANQVAEYLQAFAGESLRILNDISHVVGKTRREADVSSQRGTNHD